MLGRGSVLGDVEAKVVASAFGYFHPAGVARIWNSARERVAPREAVRVSLEYCAQLGRTALAQVTGLEGFLYSRRNPPGGSQPERAHPVCRHHGPAARR